MASHQSARNVGSHKSFLSVSTTSSRTSHPSGYGQYDHNALYKQTRRHPLPSTYLPSSSSVGILLHQSHIPSGSPCTDCRQPIGGYTQPFNHTDPRMGTRSIGLPPNLPEVEDPTHRYVRNRQQQKMHQILLQGGSRPRLPRSCVNGPVGRDTSLHVSSQRTIVHIRQTSVNAILIAPFWPRQAWFSTLRDMAVNHFELPSIPHLLTQNNGNLHHPDVQSLHLAAWRILP